MVLIASLPKRRPHLACIAPTWEGSYAYLSCSGYIVSYLSLLTKDNSTICPGFRNTTSCQPRTLGITAEHNRPFRLRIESLCTINAFFYYADLHILNYKSLKSIYARHWSAAQYSDSFASFLLRIRGRTWKLTSLSAVECFPETFLPCAMGYLMHVCANHRPTPLF